LQSLKFDLVIHQILQAIFDTCQNRSGNKKYGKHGCHFLLNVNISIVVLKKNFHFFLNMIKTSGFVNCKGNILFYADNKIVTDRSMKKLQ